MRGFFINRPNPTKHKLEKGIPHLQLEDNTTSHSLLAVYPNLEELNLHFLTAFLISRWGFWPTKKLRKVKMKGEFVKLCDVPKNLFSE